MCFPFFQWDFFERGTVYLSDRGLWLFSYQPFNLSLIVFAFKRNFFKSTKVCYCDISLCFCNTTFTICTHVIFSFSKAVLFSLKARVITTLRATLLLFYYCKFIFFHKKLSFNFGLSNLLIFRIDLYAKYTKWFKLHWI